MRRLIVLMLMLGLAGCGSEVRRKGTPVSLTGKVSQGGQPLGGVVMVFQPLGDGHTREFPIAKDGTFQGEMVSGEYAYYVAKPAAIAAVPALKKVAPKYFQADLARTVSVEPDHQLAIALD